MIRVYVVDDEKLVRRGIIGLIDWEKYGMQVVGDSGSGEETIGFLGREKVDLLFSDLEMPGLSGISFLEKVRALQPEMQIVVLTMHQEFELIQQALRIGILDYITKEQIEEENVDALMESISRRYTERIRHTQLDARKVTEHEIYIWEFWEKEQTERAAKLLSDAGISFEQLNETHLLFPGSSNIIRLKALVEEFDPQGTSLVEIKQVKDIAYSMLEEVIQTVIVRRLFEDRCPGCFFYTYFWEALRKEKPGIGRQEVLALCQRMEFMLDQETCEAGMEKIRHAALSREERTAVFYRYNLYWSEFSGKDFTKYFDEVGGFRWWYEWKAWLDGVRKLVQKKAGESEEGIETMEAIHGAVNYVREHMDREISLEELLRLTGMSKSHFSRNFKKITGKTFVTYLNDLRIETAQKYLRETNQPIYWIAGQIGYTDEHYFRRIFRERTGESPRQYREKHGKKD